MAQTPCTKRATGRVIDYTPVGAVEVGQVVVLGTSLVCIANSAIAAGALGNLDLEGVWHVPKVTGSIPNGAAVYWDADGDPLGGTAGSGAFTADSSKGPFAGFAVETTTAGMIDITLQSVGAGDTVPRSSLGQEDAVPYPIYAENWYIFDSATHAPLGATPASPDDLSYITGAAGTAEPVLKGEDFGGTSISQKARQRITLPPEYVAGQTITLRANAGMLTTLSDGSATIDFNVYRAAAPTVDVCATAAQSINSLTAANKDFTITPTDCVPGDMLDIVMTVAGTDVGNVGVMVPVVNSAAILMDIKG